MENRVHDFDSKKTRLIANATWSVGEFQAIESAPKLYMFTSSTPNRAKPRTMSTSTMREAGAAGPGARRNLRASAGVRERLTKADIYKRAPQAVGPDHEGGS